MKKLFMIVILILGFILIFQTQAWSQPVVYDLGNGYTAVENNLFDQFVKNEKLIELYKEDIAYKNDVIEKLKLLHGQSDNIQEQRIEVLKDTLGLKDNIIELKDQNIENYKNLYVMKSDEVNKYKFKNWFDKILVAALGAYAVSEIDDNTGKAAVSAITVYLFNN